MLNDNFHLNTYRYIGIKMVVTAEKMRDYSRKYRSNNRLQCNEASANHYRRNRENKKLQMRAYYYTKAIKRCEESLLNPDLPPNRRVSINKTLQRNRDKLKALE